MRTKDDFYRHVLENRRIVSDPENLNCPCPKTKCEWHGRCRECVALHRHYRDHVPDCFQAVISGRLAAAAGIGELEAVRKDTTPPEYWDYVRVRDGIAASEEHQDQS